MTDIPTAELMRLDALIAGDVGLPLTDRNTIRRLMAAARQPEPAREVRIQEPGTSGEFGRIAWGPNWPNEDSDLAARLGISAARAAYTVAFEEGRIAGRAEAAARQPEPAGLRVTTTLRSALTVMPESRERMQRYETGRNGEDDSYYIAATDRTVLISQIDRAQRELALASTEPSAES